MNYPARSAGVTKHMRPHEVRARCMGLEAGSTRQRLAAQAPCTRSGYGAAKASMGIRGWQRAYISKASSSSKTRHAGNLVRRHGGCWCRWAAALSRCTWSLAAASATGPTGPPARPSSSCSSGAARRSPHLLCRAALHSYYVREGRLRQLLTTRALHMREFRV